MTNTKNTVDFTELMNQKEIKPTIKMLLGADMHGKSKYLYLSKRTPSVIIYGQSGAGKTVLLSSLLISAMIKTTPKRLRFVLIDGKGNSFSAFNHNPFLFKQPVDATSKSGLDRARKSIENVKSIVQSRIALFKELDVSSLEQYTETHGDTLDEIVLVIDEVSALLKQDSNITDNLEYILKMSGHLGVYVLLSNQSAKPKDVNGKITANVVARPLVMKLSTFEEYVLTLDNEDPRELVANAFSEREQGIVLFEQKPIKVPYLTNEQIYQYNQEFIEQYLK